MSDVDAIRSMASEHDLEFVDLDTYGVDPAAGEILPAQVARRHHVVAVKRKFGTPVIATSDPGDLYAQDSVRASIGRDFISVVAVPEQIGHSLDRLFGAETEDGAPDDGQDDSLPTPTSEQADAGIAGPVVESLWPEVSTDDAPLFASPDESGGNEYAEEAPAVDRSANGSAYAEEATVADESVNGIGYAEEEPAADEPGGNGYVEESTAADRSASGHGRRGKKADRKARAETSPDEAVEPADARDWQDFAVIPQFDDAVDGLVDADNGPADGDDAGPDGEAGASDGPFGALVPFAQPTDDGPAVGTSGPLEQVAALEVLSDAVASLEPTTSEVPGTEPDVIGDDAHVGDGRDFTADELVELALSVHGGDVQTSGVQPSTDSTTLAADLVAEAVATYQEQHGDEQNDDVAGEEGATATAPFPPLAKALVRRQSLTRGHGDGARGASRVGPERCAYPHRPETGHRGRPHVGNGPGDGARLRRPRHRRDRFCRGRDHSRGHRPISQRGGHRQRKRGPCRGCIESHRRLRHGRSPHHHRASLRRRRRHPHADQRLHRAGVQQRRRRGRHGHGGFARLRRHQPGARR